jgi:hypothetical protein
MIQHGITQEIGELGPPPTGAEHANGAARRSRD